MERGSLSRLFQPQPPHNSSWHNRTDQYCYCDFQYINRTPRAAGTFAAFSQSFAVSFSAYCHVSSSTGALIFVSSWRKRHICRDEVEGERCAGLVACCTLTHWAFPARIPTFCGTSLSWGWLVGQAEVRRAQRAVPSQPAPLGVRSCWSLQGPQKPSACEQLNPTRAANRALDVQTHSSLCYFKLK